MALAEGLRLPAGSQLLQCVLADRLEGSPSEGASCRTRLWSTSVASPSMTSPTRGAPPGDTLPTPQIASAASSVQPPAKMPSRRKSVCSSAASSP